MSIELVQLPDVVLLKVLSFIPNRFEVASVCWRLYELVCELDRNKYRMRIEGHTFEEPIYRSIINSRRVCRHARIFLYNETHQEAEMLRNVLETHGYCIKVLSWSKLKGNGTSQKTLLESLNSLVNLEELNLYIEDFIFKDSDADTSLFLPKLRKLELGKCSRDVIELISSLLPLNVLKQLRISGFQQIPPFLEDFDVKHKLYKTQTTIESCECDFQDVQFVTKYLNLRHLQISFGESYAINDKNTQIFVNLMKSQKNLETLILVEPRNREVMNDQMFLEVCDLISLQSLKINIKGVAFGNIRRLSDLTCLKSLDVGTGFELGDLEQSFNQLSVIEGLPVDSLKISYHSVTGLKLPTIRQFGMNYCLKYLEITGVQNYKLNIFMQSFPQLETLKLRYGLYKYMRLSQIYVDDGVAHMKMKNLQLDGFSVAEDDVELFFKLIRSLQKLERFHSDHNKIMPLTNEFFPNLRDNMERMKEVCLKFEYDSVRNFSEHEIAVLQELSRKLHTVHFSIVHNFNHPLSKNIVERHKRSQSLLVERLGHFYKTAIPGNFTLVLAKGHLSKV